MTLLLPVHRNRGILTSLLGVSSPCLLDCLWCETCHKYFTCLEGHQRTHRGEKPFERDFFCGRKCADAINHNKHRRNRIHTLERNLTDVMFVEKGFRMEVVMLFIVEYILEKNLCGE